MMPDRPKSRPLPHLYGLAAALAVAALVGGCREWDTYDPRMHPVGSGQASSAEPGGGGEAPTGSTGGAGGASGVSTGGGAITSAGGAGGTGGADGAGGAGGEGGDAPPVIISVYCRDVICNPGQICCFSLTSQLLDHCGTAGSCGINYVEGSCNDPTDCPGQICCGKKPSPQSFYTEISCQATCDGSNIIMCEGAPSICPENVACKSSNLLGNGYSYCDTP